MACSDGNACTQTDVCQSGVCTGSNPVMCPAADQCHQPSTCNPATGVCSNANGAACDDGNGCTGGETCQGGVCGGGAPVVCMPSDGCHGAGVCNPSTGTCSNPALSDGTACDDGSASARPARAGAAAPWCARRWTSATTWESATR